MTRQPMRLMSVVTLCSVALGACGKGSSGGSGTEPKQADPGPISSADAAAKITAGSSAREVTEATWRALAMGGVAVADPDVLVPARGLRANWSIGPTLAFNLAAEAHDKSISGRFTVAEVAQMWQQLGFPFAGAGTPAQQLLAFLGAWVVTARQKPDALESFTPLFLQEMAQRQQPRVDLANPNTDPAEARLTLLEIELIVAAFDRDLQRTGTGTAVRSAHLESSGCAAFKEKYLGIPSKAVGSGTQKVGEYVVSGLLEEKFGWSKGSAENGGEAFGHAIEVLEMAFKVYKLIEIYASSEVTLTVDGENPVHEPPHDGARKLVPVTAHAGIPADDWKKYQQDSVRASQEYQEIKDCLSAVGAPMPTDLTEIANSLDKWLVGWELTSGSPKYASISLDVNQFAFPGALKMALARESASSAKATLQVDIAHESRFVELFPQAPEKTADVTVRASVYTAEPPDPAVLAGAFSMVGTIASLIDLSVGWVQTALPPKSTTKIHVVYRDPPGAIDVSFHLSMQYAAGDKAQARLTIAGTEKVRANLLQGPDYDAYSGVDTFDYPTAHIVVSDTECTWTLTPVSGPLYAYVGPGMNLDGQLRITDPIQQLWWNTTSAFSGPHERLHVECPPPGENFDGDIAYVTTAYTLDYDNPFPNPSGGTKQSRPSIAISDWSSLPDGSIQKVLSGGRAIAGGPQPFVVEAESTTITLTPIFEAQ